VKQELILFDASKNQTPDSTKQFGQLVSRDGLLRLQRAAAGGLENFSANAQLTWVTQQLPIVVNSQDFNRPTKSSNAAQGWEGQGSQYNWRGNLGQQTPLALNLSRAIAENPFRLDDYDQLWVDYTPTPGIKQCDMQLQFQGLLQPHDKKKQSRTVVWHTGPNFNLEVLRTLDASRADYKAKDYAYLMGRVLGLAPDEDWRFVQNQKHTVVQRRMHLKLDNAHALDIAFAAGIGVERVNLLVSRKDGYGGGKLLEFAGLSPAATLPDGRTGVRLDLRDALAQRFPREWEEDSKEAETNSFYLQEVFLYFPGDTKKVVESEPVRRLTLLGAATGVQELQTLTSQVMDVSAAQQRLLVDVRKFGTIGRVDLKQVSLMLISPKDAASCAVRINNVRAVSIHNAQVPAFAQNLEGWARSRGGPFIRFQMERGLVEQPGIVNFLPLSTFSLIEDVTFKSQKYVLSGSLEDVLETKPIESHAPIPDFRVLTEAGKDVVLENKRVSIHNGATLAFQGRVPTASLEGDSLVLRGNSNSLEITWPMATQLFEDTWFYFGVTEGAEQIAYLSLTAEFLDGRQMLHRIEPNKPFRIDSGGAQLTKLRLSLAFKGKRFRIKLRELALFSPKIATYAEARTLPLPVSMNVKLKPTLTTDTQIFMESGPGYAVGLLGTEPVRFVTLLDKHLDWVRGFNIGFRFPPRLFNEGKCPLTMQLNWANGQTLRQFCPANMEGSIFLSVASLLGAENQGRNLGALQSIEWTVAASGSRVGAMQEAFSLSFSVEGWAMTSAMDQVRLFPLIKAGKEEVYADIQRLGNAQSDSYVKRFSLPLGPGALDKIASMEGEVLLAKHPLFTLNKLVAEPRQPMDMAQWIALLDPPALNSPPRWPKLLALISVIALCWGAWKRGWWSMARLDRIFLGKGKVLCDLARVTMQWQAGLLSRLLPWLNLMVGVLALGPGLWLAGRLGINIQGGMVLSGLLFMLLGVYSHWREGTSRIWHATSWYVLTLSAGCAAWSLGYFGFQYDAAWGFLPLMAATYALLPLLYKLWSQDKRHHLLVAVFAALTLLLYGVGLILKMEHGANYFFTFGGMALVMVVRELFLVVEPRFRQGFPTISNPVYGGAGSLYFSGALVLLIGAATMLSLKLEPIAEQLAVVVYYCLVIGTVLEIAALRRNRYGHSDKLKTAATNPFDTTKK